MNYRKLFAASIGAILLLLATSASATIVGNLKTGSGSTVTFTLSSITFNTDTGANPPGPPWNSEVALTTNLTFAGCPSGVLGAAGCLDSGALSPNEGVLVANGAPINLGAGLGPNNPFLQFAGNGVTHATLLYTVTAVGPGSANTNCSGLAVGQSCSIFAGSPLILVNVGTSTTIILPVLGTATDGAGVSTWEGSFSSNFAGMTPNDIQTFFCPSGTCTAADFASGRSISSSQSGDFVASTTAVPEPASLLLMGTGLAGLAGMIRRKLRS